MKPRQTKHSEDAQEKEFELRYCEKCIQMTNHGCCKCAFKVGETQALEDELQWHEKEMGTGKPFEDIFKERITEIKQKLGEL